MKCYRKALCWLLFSLFIISPAVINGVYNYQNSHFTCLVKAYHHADNDHLYAEAEFTFDGNQGKIRSLAEYYQPGKAPIRLPQTLPFAFTYQDGKLLLISLDTPSSAAVTNLLVHLLPDIFLFKGRGIQLNLYRQTDKGFVFAQDELPVAICNKF